MKKLMIIAAVVASTACVQAASYTWGTSGAYSIDNWSGNAAVDPDLDAPMYKDGTLFLYLGTVGYTEGKGFDVGTATLLNYATYNVDQYMYGNADTGAYDASASVKNTESQAYTLILVNNGSYTTLDNVKDGDYFVLRDGMSVLDYDADIADYVAGFLDQDAITSSDWTKYSASVPEPTSAMLLLLGVAGLALRRKQA